MSFYSSGLSHIGQKRLTNQDAIYLNRQKSVFIVADGMGGHQGGDVASAIAIKCIPEYLSKHMGQNPQDPAAILTESIKKANEEIIKKGGENPHLKDMGTTVVCFFFKGRSLYVGNVGDSRAYLIKEGELFQLSKDHSMVQEKINMGLYTREQAAQDPQKNILIRSVGLEKDISVDIFQYEVEKNDLFLLCSDGLHGQVSDSDLIKLTNREISDPSKANRKCLEKTVAQMVALANDNGGSDNISTILVLAK